MKSMRVVLRVPLADAGLQPTRMNFHSNRLSSMA